MRFFLFLLFFVFLFIVQIGALPHFSVLGFSLNILLVSAFIFAFFVTNYQELMAYSFMAGFLLDIYSGIPFGIVLLSFVLSVVLVDFLAYNFLGRENIFVICAGAMAGFLAYFLIYFSILRLYGFFKISPDMAVSAMLFSKTAVFSIILNILCVAVLYAPLKRFMRFADNFKR